jgi:hypothetical protein
LRKPDLIDRMSRIECPFAVIALTSSEPMRATHNIYSKLNSYDAQWPFFAPGSCPDHFSVSSHLRHSKVHGPPQLRLLSYSNLLTPDMPGAFYSVLLHSGLCNVPDYIGEASEPAISISRVFVRTSLSSFPIDRKAIAR